MYTYPRCPNYKIQTRNIPNLLEIGTKKLSSPPNLQSPIGEQRSSSFHQLDMCQVLSHLRFLTDWSCLSHSRETQMDPRWEGPAKQTSSSPCQNPQIQSVSLSLPPASSLSTTPSTLPVTRALCQLMSLSTHLLVAPGQSDINLLNSCNLFMAENNGKNIVQNLSIESLVE